LSVVPTAEEEIKIVEEDSIELIDYLEVLWTHRWLIGLGTAAAIGIAALFGMTTPKTYQASMLIEVGTVSAPSKDESSQLVMIEDPKAIAQLLTADAMLEKLRVFLRSERFTLAGLRGALKVKIAKGGVDASAATLVELTLTLNDPQQVVDGLTFLASQLVDEHRTLYQAGLAIIDREEESLREKIQAAQVQQDNLKKQIGGLRAQTAAEARYRDGLDKNIARLEGEMAQARARLGSAASGGADALWAQNLFQSMQIHLDELRRERNESELRSRGIQAEIYGVENTAANLAGQRMDHENRIVRLAGYRTRSENTKIRSAPVLPTTPVGPRIALNVAVAGLAGAMACVVAAFAIEYVRNARRRRLFARAFSSP
jgi:uncharacterized protein involved in exopolysaccharide biosynthesis